MKTSVNLFSYVHDHLVGRFMLDNSHFQVRNLVGLFCYLALPWYLTWMKSASISIGIGWNLNCSLSRARKILNGIYLQCLCQDDDVHPAAAEKNLCYPFRFETSVTLFSWGYCEVVCNGRCLHLPDVGDPLQNLQFEVILQHPSTPTKVPELPSRGDGFFCFPNL